MGETDTHMENPEVGQGERSAASNKVVSDGSEFNPRELTVTKTTEVVAGKLVTTRGERSSKEQIAV
jgi:hypothetical protein